MNLTQQTLAIVFAVIVIVGLAVVILLMKFRDMTEASERAAKEWYRTLLVQEVDRLADDDKAVQAEIKALIAEVASLVGEIREVVQDDVLDFEGHFQRLDALQSRVSGHGTREVVFPPV